MIRVGSPHILKICCPECGEPQQQALASDFFFLCCQNYKCVYRYANVVIERRTGLVISCDAVVTYGKDNLERLFPAMYRESDGKRIWPKEEQ